MRAYFLIVLMSVVFAPFANAGECQFGKVLGFDDAYVLIANAPRAADKTYSMKQAHFIQGVRKTQIEKTFRTSIKKAFKEVDEGMIHKFEIPGTPHTSWDALTVIYGYRGESIVGAIFPDESSVQWAVLEDSGIRLCSGWDGI